MVTMLGWLRDDAERASRSKRCKWSSVVAKAAVRILIATMRLSRASRARYTSPIPPAPNAPTISYDPSLVPGASIPAGEAVACKEELSHDQPLIRRYNKIEDGVTTRISANWCLFRFPPALFLVCAHFTPVQENHQCTEPCLSVHLRGSALHRRSLFVSALNVTIWQPFRLH